MLKIINNLRPFFEDCYRRINVREYAKIMRISPPTASKLLAAYNSENFLLKDRDRNCILFYANKESRMFIEISRIYWRHRLKELTSFIEKKTINPTIVLFGSLAKAEAKSDSDIDLAVFACERGLDVKNFEDKIKRRIQIFWFKSIKDMKNRELANNIINGYVLEGRLLI